MAFPELHRTATILPAENAEVGKDPISFPTAPWGSDFILDPGGLSCFLIICCSDIPDLWGNTPRRQLAPASSDPHHTQHPTSIPKLNPLTYLLHIFKQLGLKLGLELAPSMPLVTKNAGLDLVPWTLPPCRTSPPPLEEAANGQKVLYLQAFRQLRSHSSHVPLSGISSPVSRNLW